VIGWMLVNRQMNRDACASASELMRIPVSDYQLPICPFHVHHTARKTKLSERAGEDDVVHFGFISNILIFLFIFWPAHQKLLSMCWKATQNDLLGRTEYGLSVLRRQQLLLMLSFHTGQTCLNQKLKMHCNY
jgi:hypothetical protein